MKQLACNDVSGLACEYIAEGTTAEDVKQQLAMHGMEEHPDELAALSDEQRQTMLTKIEDLLVAQEEE